jgi:NAD(P)-dependent dehydrogenase (short-subunit alcohol dehydrogenase family)
MIGRGGRIVVVASTNATFVESHITSYNASKAGLLGLVRSAALELAPEGITVNAVSPGLVVTRMTAPLVEHQVHGPDYLTHIPAGRFGTPADIAGAVGYLVSPSASWITGQQIIVDGGQTIGMCIPPETLT